ncbi:MAG: ABC transporter permease [Saprospiraceae bacterium]|nr:ABC transporter permease [Saprospiraceae bacterium]
MLKQSLQLIFRRLKRKAGYSMIHLLGLTAGFTSCLLIFLLVRYEGSFDMHHTNKDRIYRINIQSIEEGELEEMSSTPFPLADAFEAEFPAAAVGQIYRKEETTLGLTAEEPQAIKNLYFSEGSILSIFDFEILQGQGSAALEQPGNILLSRSTAERLFVDQNPIGASVYLEANTLLQVAGVYADPPPTTHIPASALVSHGSLTDEMVSLPKDNWTMFNIGLATYALFDQPLKEGQLDAQLAQFGEKYMQEPEDVSRNTPVLQPLADIHFTLISLDGSPVASISKSVIWIAISIGALILLMACFNFINLSLASNTEKRLEVSIRKVIGAKSFEIWTNLLGEAIVLSLSAFLFSRVLVELLLPFVNQLLGKSLSDSSLWSVPVLLFSLAIVLVTSLIAGGYPAWVLARQEAKMALKSSKTFGQREDTHLRRAIVVAQFMITLVIISGALTVSQQLNFIKEKDLGFQQTGILQIDLQKSDKNDVLTTEWLSNPAISDVSFAIGAPMSDMGLGMAAYPYAGNPQTDEFIVSIKAADQYYLRTYGLELVAGRDITPQEAERMGDKYPGPNEVRPVIVNQALGEPLGIRDPEALLGKKILVYINNFVGDVVGVVKDFNTSSLRDGIEPTMITPMPPQYYSIGVRTEVDNMSNTLNYLEASWAKHYPNTPFSYTFLEEYVQNQYADENRTLTLLNIFALLAILIACLGLFGLAAILTTQRKREVGLRKVLGASVSSIIGLLSKDVVRLVVVSILLAGPFAYWVSIKWLQNFTYRIDFSWMAFVLASLSLLLLAVVSISSQTVKAALTNPAAVMRDQ